MSEPIKVTKIDLGDGLWEVRNADTGDVIGYDQHIEQTDIILEEQVI